MFYVSQYFSILSLTSFPGPLRNVQAEELQQDFEGWWETEGREVLYGDRQAAEADETDFWDFEGEFSEEEEIEDAAALQTGPLDELCPVPPPSAHDAVVRVEDRSSVAQQINQLLDDEVLSEPLVADEAPACAVEAEGFPKTVEAMVSLLQGKFGASPGTASACLARVEVLSKYMKKVNALSKANEGILSKTQVAMGPQKLSPYNQLKHEIHMAKQNSMFGGARCGRLTAWFDAQVSVIKDSAAKTTGTLADQLGIFFFIFFYFFIFFFIFFIFFYIFLYIFIYV